MVNFDLNNRVAIVTGGAQGFGFSITKRFLDSGAKVIIWDIDKKAIDEASKEISSEKCSYQVVDVTNFEDINKNIENITKEKKVDIFVNNAGIAGKNEKVWNYPNDEWLKVINLDLNAVFYCCKAIVPHMINNNYGRIINIASIAGKEGNPNASAYSAAKAGVIGLSSQIRIFDQITQEHIDYMLSKIPRNRFVKVEELSSLVTWLASEENSFSTSAVFDLSGGRATY